MKSPLVSIVILNLNGASMTVKCLESIKKSDYRNREIIVVDNGSTDNSMEILSKIKGIRLIRNERNMGFAEGNNIGVRIARGKYVCMMNNDTKMDKLWLSELVIVAESDPLIAVCNPTLYDKYDQEDYSFHGYGTIGLFHAPVFLRQVDRYTQSLVRSLTASGSAFFNREIVNEPFDPDYFAYSEDAQLGWRINLMGYKVVHVPRSIVYHEGGATAKRMKVPKDFFFILAERNKLLNILTLYSKWTLVRLLPYFVIHPLFSNLYDPKRFFSRLKVYAWVVANFSLILEKRKKLQAKRRVKDSEIIKLMSCRLYDESYIKSRLFSSIVTAVNWLFMAYSWVACLRTIEFHRMTTKEGIMGPG